MNGKGFLTLIVALAILASTFVGMASAAQRWDLDDDDVMYKGEHTESGSVGILLFGSHVWQAENAATPAEGVYFPAAIWNGSLKGISLIAVHSVEIGYCDDGGSNFQSQGSSGGIITNAFSIDASAFTVPQGKHLALRVTALGVVAQTVTTDGDSYVQYPEDTPVYPVPEFAPIVLFSTGLLTLAGYMGYRRRKYIR